MTGKSEHRIALIAPWMGPWPDWINLYFESCRWNPNITWLVPTDQEPPENQPPNVRFIPMQLRELYERAEALTGLNMKEHGAYKLCDIRPLFGAMFKTELESYTHFGYTDHDIIYGQLDYELTDERLREYEIISSHGNMQAGHLSVFQNTPRVVKAWKRMPGWRGILKTPEHRGFDEAGFGRRLNPHKWHPPWRRYKVLWHEMNSMPDRGKTWFDGGPSPTRFIWKDGKLTEPRNAQPQYAYLHFMMWRSNTFRNTKTKGEAPWLLRDKIMHVDWREAAKNGFEISHEGFTLLEADQSSKDA